MNSEPDEIISYLENVLPQKIIDSNEDLKNCELIKCTATSAKSFDGFLSSLYQIVLRVEDKTSKR